MGTFTFRLPDIGEGIAEAKIVAWHVKVGDVVAEDGRVADLMTDKATVEMESPVAGKVISVAGEVGDVIAIGSPLVVIETEGSDEVEPAAEAASAPSTAEVVEAAPVVETPAPEPVALRSEEPVPFIHAPKVLASPAVRARAEALGIDLGQVKPSEEGRVRHADLDAFLAYNAGGGYRPAGAARKD